MPTGNGELGTVYYRGPRTEEWIPFGSVKEVHIRCEDEADDEPAIPMAWEKELKFETMKPTTITIKLSRKAKRRLNRALGLPEYKITEWCFPKKKKRGTMRRKRKERKEK